MSKLFVFLLVMGAPMVPALGCAGEVGYVAYDDPPAPIEENVTVRPGYIWVHGHYANDSGHWRWHGGFYERERVGQKYTEGRWERHGNQRVWINGGWSGHATVGVR
jgi:hypothetical protein